MLDISKIKSDFPILSEQVNGYPLVYLDNAATTQKPKIVIETLTDYYSHYNSNVHRGVHTLSQKATEEYEKAREKVRNFIGAEFVEEIIWTKNDSESLNLIANSWGKANLKTGDEIIISSSEHHSNIVPWQIVARETGARIHFVKLTDGFTFDYEHFFSLLSEKTKIVSLTHGSNVTGEIIDFSKIIPAVHNVGAVINIDVAQTVAHFLVDLRTNLKEADFMTFSSHKLYGPTGVGIFYGRRHHLENMEPMLTGSDMIREVFEDYSTWNDLPYKFEVGTPNIADVIALGAAIDYLNSLNKEDVLSHEDDLTRYAIEKLTELGFVELFVAKSEKNLAIVSFNVKGVHPHDVGSILDSFGIAIRTGHHCAQPLMLKLGQAATARASFALYNMKEDVDKLIDGLKEVKNTFQI